MGLINIYISKLGNLNVYKTVRRKQDILQNFFLERKFKRVWDTVCVIFKV